MGRFDGWMMFRVFYCEWNTLRKKTDQQIDLLCKIQQGRKNLFFPLINDYLWHNPCPTKGLGKAGRAMSMGRTKDRGQHGAEGAETSVSAKPPPMQQNKIYARPID